MLERKLELPEIFADCRSAAEGKPWPCLGQKRPKILSC